MSDYNKIFCESYLKKYPDSGEIIECSNIDTGELPTYRIYLIREAYLMYTGVVLTREGLALRDPFIYEDKLDFWLDKIENDEDETEDIVELNDTEYVSLLGIVSYNFWHWFYDFLPKVILCESIGFKGKYIVADEFSFKLEALELLGISKDRILLLDTYKSFYIDKLYIPQKIINDSYEDKRFKSILREIREKSLNSIKKLYPENLTIPQKIYISREKAINKRNIVNEEEVLKIITEFNIEVVYMEKMSLAEQIYLASNTTCLVGANGAGMLHSLFMPEKSLVIEFFSPVYISFVTTIGSVELLKHKYFMLCPQAYQDYKYGTEHTTPIEVHIPLLRVTLKNQLE